MTIGGFATLDGVIDLDQQVLEHTGVINCLDYLEKQGKLNWNHRDEPEFLLGDIVKACIREHGGAKGLYIEAELNPNVKAARDAYNFMLGGQQLGFSVEGVTLNLEKGAHNGIPVGNIKAAFISKVALTAEPKNYGTFAQVIKSLHAEAIKKALTAGAGTDHAGFTGGRALVTEQLGQLAGHYRRTHGRVPFGTEHFAKALEVFSHAWGLSAADKAALAEHMRTRSS